MAKIKIPFNGVEYNIDESALSTAINELKSHLSTVMNGEGATINLGVTTYNIDGAKLSTATNSFVSHLGTIAGSGEKVVVNGVEYSVDSSKVSGAIGALEGVLGELDAGGGDDSNVITWDGNTEGLVAVVLDDSSTFYKVSDRTFSNEQIKNMTYSAHMISEYGNEDYVYLINEEDGWDDLIQDGYVTDDICNLWNEIVIVRTAGATDNISGVAYPKTGIYFVKTTYGFAQQYYYITSLYTQQSDTSDESLAPGLYQTGAIALYNEQGAEAIEGMLITPWDELVGNSAIAVNNGVVNVCLSDKSQLNGDLILPDDNSITELGLQAFVNCKNLTSIKIPDSVTSIGNTAFNSCTNLTNVNIPSGVTIIGSYLFENCSYLDNITIPNSVTEIKEKAFMWCKRLNSLYYNGTIAQWNIITKGSYWNFEVPATHVHCTDGDVAL